MPVTSFPFLDGIACDSKFFGNCSQSPTNSLKLGDFYLYFVHLYRKIIPYSVWYINGFRTQPILKAVLLPSVSQTAATIINQVCDAVLPLRKCQTS